MILDKLLISNLNIIGENILHEANLREYPRNINEMDIFLQYLKRSINSQKFEGVLLANILFSFVSNKDIRNRLTTSRIFEDIFSSLFNQESTDLERRCNPICPQDIIDLDSLCISEPWSISSDLSGNKREKSDLNIGDYSISLKTLKGPLVGANDTIIDNDYNSELNIGSLSYRALLKGILTNEELQLLGDRKGGLGSGKQMRKFVLNPILNHSKKDDFLERLTLFLKYVYEEDVYIVLKSHFRLDFYLIPNSSFINSMLYTYSRNESEFEKIFYRWENNNLRLNWPNMIKAMDSFNLNYYNISLNLESSINDIRFNNFKNKLDEIIKSDIELYLNK